MFYLPNTTNAARYMPLGMAPQPAKQTDWPPQAFKLKAAISETRDTYMLRTAEVYRRGLVDSVVDEVYLTIGGNNQLITLTPIYGVLRHSTPVHYMAMIVNVKTLHSDMVQIQPGQFLEVR